MGTKDLWQSDYFDDKRRFADMINGAMFQGKSVMFGEDLEKVDSNLVYHDNRGEVVNVIRDKVYRWKGQNVSICVLENQSYVDYRMVFRVMLEEAVSYMKQQKRAYQKWKETGYKFNKNEFISKMRKEEKYIPVITLVLYLGKEKWDGVKTLYEMLDIDEESVKAIFGMLDIKADINKYKIKTEKGVKYHMCKAWDDHMERGRQEGRQEEQREGLLSLVNILSTIFSDFETIYNKIVSDEKYQNVTREQVEKYYYAK